VTTGTVDSGPMPDLVAALARFNAGEAWDTIGPDYGKTGNGIRKAVRRAQMRGRIEAQGGPDGRALPVIDQGSGIAWTETANGATLESGKSATVRTLDDLLATCEVDLTRWTVARYVVNKWDSAMRGQDSAPVLAQLYQVKAWLEPIRGVDAARELFAGLLADLANSARVYEPVTYAPLADDDRHMLELDPFDLHVGMLAWAEETGADYDSEIATDLAKRAAARLIQLSSGFRFERVLIPLGNDLAHTDRTVDGKGGATTRGTQQDVDTRPAKMTRAVINLCTSLIDAARQIAPVTVVIVPGNHDGEKMPLFGEVLSAWYRNDGDVTIVNDPAPRQYVRYGASLIGLTHGHEGKAADLPLIMATERTDFGAATYRLWRVGHLHRKGETVSEHGGVRVCVAPSLAARDHWHATKGYGHMRAMEAHVWHREYGPIGQFTATVPAINGGSA